MTAVSPQSSGSADRRGRIAVAVLGLALVVSGCGGGAPDRRETVDRYLRQVNSVQAGYTTAFKDANRAYVAFSKGKLEPSSAKRRLASAEQSMRDSRDRLDALPAPRDASELKRRLVALMDANAAMAHEATLLAGFVPAAERAGKPLPELGEALSAGLKRAEGPAAQVSVLERYARGIARVIEKLQPLRPPPLLIDRHHAQLEHLRSIRRLSLQLVGALRDQDSALVARLLLRFRRLSERQGPGTVVNRDALESYDRRRRAIQRAMQSVQREQRRLEERLG